MKITKTQAGQTITYVVSGRQYTVTAPDLGKEIDAVTPDIKELVLDFDGLEYISSAGIRTVLTAQKKMNKQGVLKLRHVCPAVLDVFELTGFADILTIEK